MSRKAHFPLARLASLRRSPGSAPGRLEFRDAIVIRLSRESDRPALERLAALDSKPLPAADSFLLAEIDGELASALSLEREGELLHDPFRPTLNLRALLTPRAARALTAVATSVGS